MGIEYNEISEKSQGGTEIMCRQIEKSLNPKLLEKFQIIPSRVRDLDETKIRILYLHDLPGDPESQHLANNGWMKFHKLVFVTHWQRQQYVNTYQIPWSKTIVMQNAIVPLESKQTLYADDKKINLIYHTTPHRGLEILYPVFSKLAEEYKDIHLDVFSSFEIYGWKERDKPYQKLFDELNNHPMITYHGYQPNSTIRDYLANAHIFAFPSIWPETSCIALMEAMSAGCACVHPDFAALPETGANWTLQYAWHESPNQHASTHYQLLKATIEAIKNGENSLLSRNKSQKAYADLFYSWNLRKVQWEHLLDSLKDLPTEIESPEETVIYRTL